MEGGLVTAIGAAAAGDIIWVKDTHSAAATRTIAGPNAAADFVNPVRVYGVLPATTNENGDVVKADLIPGIATDGKGTTPAYDHASAPKVATTSNLDIHFSGSIYFYGIWFESNDKLNCNTSNSALIFEECKLGRLGGPTKCQLITDDIQDGGAFGIANMQLAYFEGIDPRPAWAGWRCSDSCCKFLAVTCALHMTYAHEFKTV